MCVVLLLLMAASAAPWAVEAERALGEVLTPAPLTARTVQKPSFRALHDTVSALTASTGFALGLYTAEEASGSQRTAEAKRLYVSKLTGLVGVHRGVAIEPKPIADAVLLAGADARPLAKFLILMAEAAGGGCGPTPTPSTTSSRSSSRAGSARAAPSERPAATPPPPDATPPDEDGIVAWVCTYCGHEHEEEKPYCELCAKIRRMGGGAGSRGAVASEEAAVRPNGLRGEDTEPSAEWFDERVEGGGVQGGRPSARARGGSGRSSAEAARGGSASARAGREHPAPPRGRAAAPEPLRPEGSRSEGRVPEGGRGGRSSQAGGRSGGRGARRRMPEGEPDAHLGGEEEGEEGGGFFEEQLAGRWQKYQHEQRRREAERQQAEEQERARNEKQQEQARRRAEDGGAHSGTSSQGGYGSQAYRSAAAQRSAEERARSAAAQDEQAWSRFAQGGGEGPICAADVPWPTLNAAALGLDPRLASAAERKQAFRSASLRWHPDKFVQSYGARLVPEERDEILKRVTEVSQEINSLYSAA